LSDAFADIAAAADRDLPDVDVLSWTANSSSGATDASRSTFSGNA
jgi:hypothetical protein